MVKMTDMKKGKTNFLINVEEKYDKLKDFGENVRQEYEQLYQQMWLNLKATHFEPFSKILKEHENIAMKDEDELLEFVRSNLQLQLENALNNQWQANNVSEALKSLEMCKEKFKSYEGHKWEMDSKTPLERTRPTRMRFKENRLRYLRAQLEFQNKQLDEAVQENVALRKYIQDVKQRRIYLMETMTEFRKKMEFMKTETKKLHMLLDESNNDENIEPNNLEGNENIL